MRDYAKVSPKMWHGKTAKDLRKRGFEALLVGLYLMTSPSSNMLGMFSQPVLYMAHETGLGIEGAMKGLHACIDAGFCAYDEDTEFVFVFEMARYQIDSELSPKDLRCKGIQKEYDNLPDNPFLGAFFDRYAKAFHMTCKRQTGQSEQAPYQAPTKPLRSQEQEQEQEQELSPSLRSGERAGAKSAPRPSRPKRDEVTLTDYLEICKSEGRKPIPADHAIRSYCSDAGITDEMLQVAWLVFKDRHLNAEKTKKYKDWPGTFANSVKGRWYSLWFIGVDGSVGWTSTGMQEKTVLDARMKAREAQHEPA